MVAVDNIYLERNKASPEGTGQAVLICCLYSSPLSTVCFLCSERREQGLNSAASYRDEAVSRQSTVPADGYFAVLKRILDARPVTYTYFISIYLVVNLDLCCEILVPVKHRSGLVALLNLCLSSAQHLTKMEIVIGFGFRIFFFSTLFDKKCELSSVWFLCLLYNRSY